MKKVLKVLGFSVGVLVAMLVWATLVTLLGQFVLIPLYGAEFASVIRFILSATGGGLIALVALTR